MGSVSQGVNPVDDLRDPGVDSSIARLGTTLTEGDHANQAGPRRLVHDQGAFEEKNELVVIGKLLLFCIGKLLV